jgi:hypothetical protein
MSIKLITDYSMCNADHLFEASLSAACVCAVVESESAMISATRIADTLRF